MTSTTASATSDITSIRRTHVRPADAVERCPDSLSELLTMRSRRCSSGDRPKMTPVNSETTRAKSRTRRIEYNLT